MQLFILIKWDAHSIWQYKHFYLFFGRCFWTSCHYQKHLWFWQIACYTRLTFLIFIANKLFNFSLSSQTLLILKLIFVFQTIVRFKLRYLQPTALDFYEETAFGDEDTRSRKSLKSVMTSYTNRTFLGAESGRDAADLHDDKGWDALFLFHKQLKKLKAGFSLHKVISHIFADCIIHESCLVQWLMQHLQISRYLHALNQ